MANLALVICALLVWLAAGVQPETRVSGEYTALNTVVGMGVSVAGDGDREGVGAGKPTEAGTGMGKLG